MKYLTFILLLTAMACRAGITEAQAVKAIIGEAGGESYVTQVAVACAIRNRKTLQGVYGVNNPCVARASAKTRKLALKAWRESARHDIVHGCRFFGCRADSHYFKIIGLHPVCWSGGVTFWK